MGKYKCEKCDRNFKNKAGLLGHYRFKHRWDLNAGKPVEETIFMREVADSLRKNKIRSKTIKDFEEWRKRKMKATRQRDFETWRRLRGLS